MLSGSTVLRFNQAENTRNATKMFEEQVKCYIAIRLLLGEVITINNLKVE